MLSVIAVGPAIESAVAHRGEIIGDEIATELITLVHDRPERTSLWLPAHPIRIAQARGEQAALPARRVDLQDGGAPLLFLKTVLADIAVGADRCGGVVISVASNSTWI